MKKLILLTVACFLLFTFNFSLVTCDSTEPPPVKPQGYQEDIQWPSLADSPWPMNHGDPQGTGRSKYSGPAQGIITGYIPSGMMQNSIVIGNNKTVYFSPTRDTTSLKAANYAGDILWQVNMRSFDANLTPLIANNDNIYFYSRFQNDHYGIYAASPQGDIKWSYTQTSTFSLGMNIGKDGTIYFIDDDHNLIALSSNGELKWECNDPRFQAAAYSILTFSPDGETLYLNCYSGATLAAFDLINKTIKWTWGTDKLFNTPVVDAQGNIYIFPSSFDSGVKKFYSLNSNGTIRWEFEYSLNSEFFNGLDPTIDKNGNIYFGYTSIYSLTYEGKLRWEYRFENDANFCPLICDKDGNIYAGTLYNKIISLDNNGNLRWEVTAEIDRTLGCSPAISEDGLLFFPAYRSERIVIIK